MIIIPKAKSNKKKIKFAWQFDKEEVTLYTGTLYENYHNQNVLIKERYKGKFQQYYKIYSLDGKYYIGDVLGSTLNKIEDVIE